MIRISFQAFHGDSPSRLSHTLVMFPRPHSPHSCMSRERFWRKFWYLQNSSEHTIGAHYQNGYRVFNWVFIIFTRTLRQVAVEFIAQAIVDFSVALEFFVQGQNFEDRWQLSWEWRFLEQPKKLQSPILLRPFDALSDICQHVFSWNIATGCVASTWSKEKETLAAEKSDVEWGNLGFWGVWSYA